MSVLPAQNTHPISAEHPAASKKDTARGAQRRGGSQKRGPPGFPQNPPPRPRTLQQTYTYLDLGRGFPAVLPRQRTHTVHSAANKARPDPVARCGTRCVCPFDARLKSGIKGRPTCCRQISTEHAPNLNRTPPGSQQNTPHISTEHLPSGKRRTQRHPPTQRQSAMLCALGSQAPTRRGLAGRQNRPRRRKV